MLRTWFRSEDAQVRVCALDQCVDGNAGSGNLSIGVSSTAPFFVSIETSSRNDAVVVISRIVASGEFCPLKTAEQTVCDQLTCNFKGEKLPVSLLSYRQIPFATTKPVSRSQETFP